MTDAREALLALERAGVLAELRAGPEPSSVWELGSGEEGLGAELAAALPGLRLTPAGSPTDAQPADPPTLTIVEDSADARAEPWLQRAFELGCPYVYARRDAAAPARGEAVDRWYWRYDVVAVPAGRLALGEVWEQAAGQAASASRNRYRHTVGWRRLLPTVSTARPRADA